MYKDLLKGRNSLPSQIYLITSCTRLRKPIFNDFNHARILISEMKHAQQLEYMQFLTWVIMPDHFHFLVSLGTKIKLPIAIKIIKGRTAHALSKNNNRMGSIWQRGFHDRALRKDESVLGAARYIVANPLRAGLVKSLKDYPHWDSIWL